MTCNFLSSNPIQTFWLDVANHETRFNQSECFIPTQSNYYSTRKFFCEITAQVGCVKNSCIKGFAHLPSTMHILLAPASRRTYVQLIDSCEGLKVWRLMINTFEGRIFRWKRTLKSLCKLFKCSISEGGGSNMLSRISFCFVVNLTLLPTQRFLT